MSVWISCKKNRCGYYTLSHFIKCLNKIITSPKHTQSINELTRWPTKFIFASSSKFVVVRARIWSRKFWFSKYNASLKRDVIRLKRELAISIWSCVACVQGGKRSLMRVVLFQTVIPLNKPISYLLVLPLKACSIWMIGGINNENLKWLRSLPSELCNEFCSQRNDKHIISLDGVT